MATAHAAPFWRIMGIGGYGVRFDKEQSVYVSYKLLRDGRVTDEQAWVSDSGTAIGSLCTMVREHAVISQDPVMRLLLVYIMIELIADQL